VGDAVQVTVAGLLVGGAVALAPAQLLRTLLLGVTTYGTVITAHDGHRRLS
jgi:hypothetical protein